MAFLLLNLIDPTVAHGSFHLDDPIKGAGITDAQDGSARNNFNAVKITAGGKTLAMTQQDALFLRAMLRGRGDHWSFETDTASDKGRTSSSVTGAVVVSSAQFKFGSKSLIMPNVASDQITWATEALTAGYTVLVWRLVTGGSGWDLYVIAGDPSGGVKVYKNGSQLAGAAGTTMPTWLAVVTGAASTVQLKRDAADAAIVYYDDLVVIPAQAHSTVITYAFYSTWFSTGPWATPANPYPALQCTGDFYPATLAMLGKPGAAQGIRAALDGGAFSETLHELTFELQEA